MLSTSTILPVPLALTKTRIGNRSDVTACGLQHVYTRHIDSAGLFHQALRRVRSLYPRAFALKHLHSRRQPLFQCPVVVDCAVQHIPRFFLCVEGDRRVHADAVLHRILGKVRAARNLALGKRGAVEVAMHCVDVFLLRLQRIVDSFGRDDLPEYLFGVGGERDDGEVVLSLEIQTQRGLKLDECDAPGSMTLCSHGGVFFVIRGAGDSVAQWLECW